jgi:hypothetical protein
MPIAILPVAFALLGAAPQAQEPKPLRFRAETGWIYVRNYSTLTGNVEGNTTITGAGGPMVIEDTGRGLTITGKAMQIILRTNPDRTTSVDSVTVADGGQVVFDSEVAYRTAVEVATAQRPAPEKPNEISRTQLESDTILYRREGDAGVLTMPQASTMIMDSRGDVVRVAEGKTTRSPFTQNLQVKGTKARFTIALDATGQLGSPRTGRIDGPVTFRLVRNEQVADEKQPNGTRMDLTDFTGRADLMEADLDGPAEPALTATGNVHVEGQARGLPAEVSGAKAVVTLDKTFKPVRYDFSGTPATTRVQFKKDGGR